MTPKQVRAMQLAGQIKKLIYSRFDENDIFGGVRMLLRWNKVRRVAFYGEKEWTPGEMLDDWVETRQFESRF